MQLLTINTRTPAIGDAYITQGGLVDRQTAAADCDVLWTDSTAPSMQPTRADSASPCPVCASPHRGH
jgi:hypothetical protein